MYSAKCFGRHFANGLILFSILVLSTSCIASRKFVRSEVGSSADQLNGKIEKTDGNVKEVGDRVGTLDTRTTQQGQRIDGLNGDIQKTNGELQKTSDRTTQAQSAAQTAQTAADQARGRVVTLEENFQNRNQYSVTTEKSILFQFDKSTLDKEYMAMLDEVAQMVTQNHDALILLEGRTDSVGTETYNIQLGERRAEAVKRYLVVDKAIPMYKIHETSFGAAKPVADNKSKEGREKNRAVEVSVLVPRTATKAASNSEE